jgi:replicative superfamily II helicase
MANFDFEIIIFGVLGLLFLWNLILSIFFQKMNQRQKVLFSGKKAQDLEGVIFEILKKQKIDEKEIEKIKESIKNLELISLRSIQKIGMVRFNPFSDMGGNQSFSIALLDQKNNGVVVTSYHAKEGTRIYAKPIKEGRSSFTLTEEEKEAIEKAIFEK